MTRKSFLKSLAAAGVVLAFPITWTCKQTKRVFTGSKVRLIINGQEVGYFRDVSFEDKLTGEIHVLGESAPTEGPYTVTMNMKKT